MNKLRIALWLGSISSALFVVLPSLAPAAAQTRLKVGSPSATSTFESIGIEVDFSGDDNKNAECAVEYRPKNTSGWRRGHPLFADHRLNEHWGIGSRQFRGSIVGLAPATTYTIKLDCRDPNGGSTTRTVEASTWDEKFPGGKVVAVKGGSTPLRITESGTPDGYVVYQPAGGRTATIDVKNAHNYNVIIDADYVIVRNLVLTGSKQNGIVVEPGRHHVVIEHNDISNWGPARIGNMSRFKAAGIMADSATRNLVIQNNSIHDPRGGANSWEKGNKPWQTGKHPAGPQAITIRKSKGGHVIRYNRLYSEGPDHYYDDVIGGGGNGEMGNVSRDTDIYGNVLSHSWDDGMEIEGWNINVRIWGNTIHNTFTGIATASPGYNQSRRIDNSLGPVYIWRNVMYDLHPSIRTQAHGATKIRGDGGYYFYHNTILSSAPLGVEGPMPIYSPQVGSVGVVKNNINLSPRPYLFSNRVKGAAGARWFFDHNLYAIRARKLLLRPGWGANAVTGASPKFVGKTLRLAPGSPGIDAGAVIPNFSDGYAGEAPDMGAFEFIPGSTSRKDDR